LHPIAGVRPGDVQLPGDIGVGRAGVPDEDVEKGVVQLVHGAAPVAKTLRDARCMPAWWPPAATGPRPPVAATRPDVRRGDPGAAWAPPTPASRGSRRSPRVPAGDRRPGHRPPAVAARWPRRAPPGQPPAKNRDVRSSAPAAGSPGPAP